MKLDEFKKYIESIGFEKTGSKIYYEYKDFSIYLWNDEYELITNMDYITHNSYENLEPINITFKKELRSIKLKQLLR